MRVIGIILVTLGALALGYQGFTYMGEESVTDASSGPSWQWRGNTMWITPVASGIVVVVGSLLIALNQKRD